jgi:hypothetical protein
MRLAFCFMSNRLDCLRSLINLDYDNNVPPYIIESYTKNILFNPPIRDDIYIDGSQWNYKWLAVHTGSPKIDYFTLRQASLEMAGNADLIYVGDDDFIFGPGASGVINECCLYMEEHLHCGAILLGANFGAEGAKHGNEIYITNHGHLNTNRGIIVRNRAPVMDSNFHALGAMEDSIISFTCLMDGYYIARRLHVPIEHFVTRNTLAEDHDNPNYDLKFIKHRGIWNRVEEVLGRWPMQEVWPREIFREYRQAAMINEWPARYQEDGTIIGGSNGKGT